MTPDKQKSLDDFIRYHHNPIVAQLNAELKELNEELSTTKAQLAMCREAFEKVWHHAFTITQSAVPSDTKVALAQEVKDMTRQALSTAQPLDSLRRLVKVAEYARAKWSAKHGKEWALTVELSEALADVKKDFGL